MSNNSDPRLQLPPYLNDNIFNTQLTNQTLIEPEMMSKEQCNKYVKSDYYRAIFGYDNSDPPFTEEELRDSYNNVATQYLCTDTVVSNKVELAEIFYNKFKTSTFGSYIPFHLTGVIKAPTNFQLPKYNYKSNKCNQLGWPQSGGDCWIDSYLYGIFMNDRLSPIVSSLCDKIIRESDPNSYEYKIIMCINMYLHMLKEKYRKTDYSQYKKQLKFCILVFGYKIAKINGFSDNVEFGLQSGQIWIEGGTINDLSLLFQNIFSPYFTNYHPFNIYFYGTGLSNNLIRSSAVNNKLLYHITDFKNNIEQISLSDKNIIYQYFLNIGNITGKTPIDFKNIENIFIKSNNSYYNLETITIGAYTHQTTYTICDGKWRYYNNELVSPYVNKRSKTPLIKSSEITPISARQIYTEINNAIRMGKFDNLLLTYIKGRSANLTKGGRRKTLRLDRKRRLTRSRA